MECVPMFVQYLYSVQQTTTTTTMMIMEPNNVEKSI